MHDTNSGERFATSPGRAFYGHRLTGQRAQGAATGRILVHGRSNKADRQHVADDMATITETATVGTLTEGDMGRYYPVTFTVTHRITPIKEAR